MRIGTLGLGALLYGALALGANALAAGLDDAGRTALKAAATGHMAKLVVHPAPRDALEGTFRDRYGNAVTLAKYRGKVVVLNFWATWCPPCRAEMPSIDRLAGSADDGVAVIALSTDRFDVSRVIAFFDEIGVQNLRVLQDRRGVIARSAGVLGLPVTVLLDREGREVARLQGDAEWDSAEAERVVALLESLTAETDRAALD